MTERPKNTLNKNELERYARHIVMSEVGGAGQQKLKNAKVAVVGAGGLGTPTILYLAAAGVGTIRVIDNDKVSLSNLQRQIIYKTNDVGKPKVKCVEKLVKQTNPNTKVETKNVRLSDKNARKLISQCDVVVEGTDNYETRICLANECQKQKITLVTAAVSKFDGAVTTIKPWTKNKNGKYNPRYKDIFPQKPTNQLPCAEAGIIGTITGIIGTIQANETIKEIIGMKNLVGELLMIDLKDMRFQIIKYRRKK